MHIAIIEQDELLELNQPSRFPDHAEYRFRHDLTREAVASWPCSRVSNEGDVG